MAKCRPGDLAVIVSAHHRCNIGKVVQVVRLHGRGGDFIGKKWPDPIWWVTSAARLKYRWRGKVYLRKAGPCPDYKLQPIRGSENPQQGYRSLGLPVKKPVTA